MIVLAVITLIMSIILTFAAVMAGAKEKRVAYFIGFLIAICLMLCEVFFAVLYLIGI